MAVTHATAVRNDVASMVCTATAPTFQGGTGQKIIIYSGTPPTNAATGLSGNTAIATITAISFGAASGGVCTVSASTADPSAVGGTATFYRRTKSDGTTVIDQGLVGTSAAELIVSSTTIAAGATVTLNAGGTYTAMP
jgi:hypothetical protein